MENDKVYKLLVESIINASPDEILTRLNGGTGMQKTTPEGYVEISVNAKFISREVIRHVVDNSLSLFNILGDNKTSIVSLMILDKIKKYLFKEVWSNIEDDDYEKWMKDKHIHCGIGLNEYSISIGFHCSLLYELFVADLEVENVQND